jgi:hypothetical protein
LKALALQSKASEQSIAGRCNWVLRLRFLFCDFKGFESRVIKVTICLLGQGCKTGKL